MKIQIDSPEEALACAKEIYKWAADANDGSNLTAEIGAMAAKVIMSIEEYLTDRQIGMLEDRDEQNLAEWAETGKTNLWRDR